MLTPLARKGMSAALQRIGSTFSSIWKLRLPSCSLFKMLFTSCRLRQTLELCRKLQNESKSLLYSSIGGSDSPSRLHASFSHWSAACTSPSQSAGQSRPWLPSGASGTGNSSGQHTPAQGHPLTTCGYCTLPNQKPSMP